MMTTAEPYRLAKRILTPARLLVLVWIVVFTGGSILLSSVTHPLLVECGSGSGCYILGEWDEDYQREIEGGAIRGLVGERLGYLILAGWLIAAASWPSRNEGKLRFALVFEAALGLLFIPLLISPVLLAVAVWLDSDSLLRAGLRTEPFTEFALEALPVWLITFLAWCLWGPRD